MMYSKALGFAVVAAMALLVFAGSGAASATVLCSATETPCSHKWSVATSLDFSLVPGTSSRTASTGGQTIDTCAEATIEGAVGSAGSRISTAVIGANALGVAWRECTTSTITLIGVEMEIHSIGGSDNGDVTARNLEVTVTLFGSSCVYGLGAGAHLGSLTAGNAARLDVSTVLSKITGGILCPVDLAWTAEYALTAPQKTLDIEPE